MSASGSDSGNSVTFTIATGSEGVCSFATDVVSFTGVGTCTILADQAGSADYNAAPQVSQSFAVEAALKAALTVTANNQSKTYGGADPVFTVGYVGFVNGQTSSVLGGSLAFSFIGTNSTSYASSATVPANSGTYAISPSGLTSSNYAITFHDGAYAITQAGSTVSVTCTPAPPTRTPGTRPDAVHRRGHPGAGIEHRSPASRSATTTTSTPPCRSPPARPSAATPTAPGNTNSATFTIGKADQVITFGPLADKTLAQSPVTIGATASSGLAVDFSSNSVSVCTVRAPR